MGRGAIQICVKFLVLPFISHVALHKYSSLMLSFVICEMDTIIVTNTHLNKYKFIYIYIFYIIKILYIIKFSYI